MHFYSLLCRVKLSGEKKRESERVTCKNNIDMESRVYHLNVFAENTNGEEFFFLLHIQTQELLHTADGCNVFSDKFTQLEQANSKLQTVVILASDDTLLNPARTMRSC